MYIQNTKMKFDLSKQISLVTTHHSSSYNHSSSMLSSKMPYSDSSLKLQLNSLWTSFWSKNGMKLMLKFGI